MRAFLAPRFWAAHLLMVLAVVAAVLLGLWQLSAWQAGREASVRDVSEAPAKDLADVMGPDQAFPGRALGRPVRFRGSWLDESTTYVDGRMLDGRRGYWVVTPVLVAGGDPRSAMPVVRGWSPRPAAAPVSGEVEITGWLQASEGSGESDPNPTDDIIQEMRIASLVQRVDADLYSGYVVDRRAGGGLRQVTPGSIPQISPTDHVRNLLYGFQWWAFGGLAVYMWWRWIRDQLEAPTSVPEQPVTV